MLMKLSPRRTELATSISALRRVRPRVPFWELAAHRIPTLWSLYRGLIRATSHHEHIQWRIKTLFDRYKNLTSPTRTKEELARGHRWLSVFRKGSENDKHSLAIMNRYDCLIAAKREREHWKEIFRNELRWQEKLRNRAILTGGIVRPSLFNRPFPRMKPQPIHVSRMIYKRRRSRQKRQEVQSQYSSWKEDLRHEHEFETRLANEAKERGLKLERAYDSVTDWNRPIDDKLHSLSMSYSLDMARSRTPISPELAEIAKEARREKIRNKTRERERERRGEVLRSTIRWMRKGPPAHILDRMTPEQRRIDRIVRRPSEAGYTGKIKREFGMKLKDDQTWRLEDGDPGSREKLDKMERAIRNFQERRRILEE